MDPEETPRGSYPPPLGTQSGLGRPGVKEYGSRSALGPVQVLVACASSRSDPAPLSTPTLDPEGEPSGRPADGGCTPEGTLSVCVGRANDRRHDRVIPVTSVCHSSVVKDD